MSRILVTGGAGYIGSHIVRMLVEEGRDVVVVDNLSEGHRAAVGEARLVEGDFGDGALLDDVMAGAGIDYVVHMAAFCQVGESVSEPARYYSNNLVRSLTLLDRARRHGVRGLVLSSTAAVYGEPQEVPIAEDHPTRPTNPYGETKLAFEHALEWHRRAYGTSYVALRYFNAAGAHPDGTIGEDHAHETHLIPIVLRAVLDETRVVQIYGDDYPTPDGTCIRDYVHVVDLARAHLLAIEEMARNGETGTAFNLGNGTGFSVREVVDAVVRVTGRSPSVETAPRRPGDPSRLVASSERIRKALGWEPAFPELDEIIRTAWNWHRSHPRGYDDSAAG